MSEEIKQIAERLVGLRDALDLKPEEIAAACHVDLDTYLGYESGQKDIPVSFLHQIARHYGVELPALMFGYEPRMNAYFLTRKDKGVAVERTKAYKYQSLAAGFANRKADPFMVTVEPTAPDAPFDASTALATMDIPGFPFLIRFFSKSLGISSMMSIPRLSIASIAFL